MKFGVGVAPEKSVGEVNIISSETPSFFREDVDELINYAKNSSNPVFVLDNCFRVLYKNRGVKKYIQRLDKGEKVFRFLPENAKFKVENMRDRDILATEFSNGEFRCNASIVSVGEFRILTLEQVATELCPSVSDVYNKMSGYDIKVDFPIGLKDFCKFNFDAVGVLLSEAVLEYKEKRRAVFFKSNTVLNSFLKVLERKEIKVFESIDLRFSGKEYVSAGSERDFALMVACMLVFCIAVSKDRCALIDINGIDGFTDVVVESNTALGDEEILDFAKLKYNKTINSEEKAWIHLLKLLADFNLWDFEPVGKLDGRVGFSLRMPVAEDFDEFSLRDVDRDYISKIVSALFSD